MNKFQFSLSLLTATAFVLGMGASISQSVLADEVIAESINQPEVSNNFIAKSISEQVTPENKDTAPEPGTFSYNAADLQPENNSSLDNQIANAPVNLETFCKNYPFNSRCTQRPTPSTPKPSEVQPTDEQKTDNITKSSGWAITSEVSTLGFGASVTKSVTPNLNARLGLNYFSTGIDVKNTDVTYKSDVNLFNVSTVVDYHPWKNSGFRVTGGLVFNDNNVEGNAKLNSGQKVTIGNQTFDSNQLGEIKSKISFPNSVAPYLGIGWGNAVKPGQRFGFSVNLGVMFPGSPQVDITGSANSTLPVAQRTLIQNQLNSAIPQEKAKLENDLDWLNFYPVFSLGLSYQF
ncbi:MAG: hypothetical protein KA716_27585 [Gloeotrichia echinulata DEX184]|nr:hypothetical protein [Gloeotrichia echinulata DEX184]